MDQYPYQNIFYFISKENSYAFPHLDFIVPKFMIYRQLLERDKFCSQTLWIYCKLHLKSPNVVSTHTHTYICVLPVYSHISVAWVAGPVLYEYSQCALCYVLMVVAAYVEKFPHIFTLISQAGYIWYTCRNTCKHAFT
jgi:hypothetical protein